LLDELNHRVKTTLAAVQAERSLNGTAILDYAADGLQCSIRLPLGAAE
jgi:two-component sensor histidine kinase